MADVIIMPKLGFNMDRGDLVAWHKAVGEEVKKGEVLFEINTDKTNMPVEATADGVLLKILVGENETADVFTPIAVVGKAGENPEQALAAYQKGAGEGTDVSEAQPEAAQPEKAALGTAAVQQAVVDRKDLKLTPKAKKYMADHNLDTAEVSQIKGTGYEGGITARDILISPLAKKLAEKNHIDTTVIEGTGLNGKIMKKDVEQAAGQAAAASSPADAEKKILSEVPYKGIRKLIGDRMCESKFTAPHLYFTDEVDTTNLTKFRKELNENSEEKIGVNDLLVLAASKALTKYSAVNSSLTENKIVTYRSTNIGVAVAGDNGLIVPVIKNVQEKNLTAVAKESTDLVTRARAGQLKSEEYSGGTFTISNLGMFGIDNFTAIINQPESAILAVSSVKKKPVVVEIDGEDVVAIKPMMNLQLTVDHRVIDGLLAAQFLGYLKELIENPLRIVM